MISNKLITTIDRLSNTHIVFIDGTQINLILDDIKTKIDNKDIKELIFSIQEKIKLADTIKKSRIAEIKSFLGLKKDPGRG